MRTAVADLSDEDFAQPSGRTGWLVRDLVCHLIIDARDALIVRLAAAYQDPRLLKFHLDDVGSAAGRAADLADPTLRVSTRDQVLTAADYLSAYVLEWTLHHLDLITHLPVAPQPPADTLLIATGRRAPTDSERSELGDLAKKLPFVLG